MKTWCKPSRQRTKAPYLETLDGTLSFGDQFTHLCLILNVPYLKAVDITQKQALTTASGGGGLNLVCQPTPREFVCGLKLPFTSFFIAVKSSPNHFVSFVVRLIAGQLLSQS